MDYMRNLLVSATVALALVGLSFLAFSTQSTAQFPGWQQPLATTERGFPLPFQYAYNCQVPHVTYCATATPPLNAITPSSPYIVKWDNLGLDYAFWFAVSLVCVFLLDALTAKRFTEIEQKGVIVPQ
jgi:amino acid permease